MCIVALALAPKAPPVTESLPLMFVMGVDRGNLAAGEPAGADDAETGADAVVPGVADLPLAPPHAKPPARTAANSTMSNLPCICLSLKFSDRRSLDLNPRSYKPLMKLT